MQLQRWTKKKKHDVAISSLYHIITHCLLLNSYNVRQCFIRWSNMRLPSSQYINMLTQLVYNIECEIKQIHHYNSLYAIRDVDVIDYAEEHNMKITVIPHWID